jgi:hypothetical protein
VARVVTAIAATFGLGAYAAGLPSPIAVGYAARVATFGAAAATLWLGLLCALGETDESFRPVPPSMHRRLRLAALLGARRVGFAVAPLACLPLVLLLGARRADHMALVLAAGSLVLLCFAETRRIRATAAAGSALPGFARPDPSQVGGWEVFSLLSCLCATGWFVVVGLHAHGNNDNDAAYYFAVARHIVSTGRFEEPLVWHYLTSPASVLHAPFDYWQGLTSILLLLPMALFGATPRVAMTSMALLAGFALVLLWYVVAIAAPLRSRLAQGVALVLFAASPAMHILRFDTESVPVFHVVLLAALAAFARGRYVLAASAGFLLYLTRGDGAVACALLWLAGWLAVRRAEGRIGKSTLRLSGAICALLCVHGGFCLLMYGSLTPPGARAAAFMSDYLDLYRFGGPSIASPWVQRIQPPQLLDRFWSAWDNLRTIAFLPHQPVWIALILCVGWRGSPWPLTRLVWLLLFCGAGAVAVASGAVFASWRALYTALPLVVLAAVAALDVAFVRIEHWSQRARWPRASAFAVSVSVLVLLAIPIAQLRPYATRPHGLAGLEQELRTLAPMLENGAVASMHPWSVAAVTDRPAIMIPIATEAQIEQVFRRYGVTWLILSDQPCLGATASLCAAIRARKKTALGALRIRRLAVAGGLELYSVHSDAELRPTSGEDGRESRHGAAPARAEPACVARPRNHARAAVRTARATTFAGGSGPHPTECGCAVAIPPA